MPKDFRTIEEQLDLLESRGLSIPDKRKAEEFLLKNNYYRVSGYSLTLRHHDQFNKGASFQNIVDIYEFDREFRNALLKAIEIIEVNFKSIYVYYFSKIYGPIGYENDSIFSQTEQYSLIISKVEAQKRKRLSQEAYLQHFAKDLNESVPFWAYIDLFTIADISILFSISPSDVKELVAKQYGLKNASSVYALVNFMHGVTIVRNLAAHGSRLYNRLFITKPNLNKSDKKLLRTEKGLLDNNRIYGHILNMRRFLPIQDFQDFKSALIELTGKYPFVAMRYYGFREDWKNVLQLLLAI
jgi:abortive infection bacteriophage resistance protein